MATSGASSSTYKGTSIPTTNLTQPCSIDKASALFVITIDNTWIIDTGASDHMIKDSRKLQNICPSS